MSAILAIDELLFDLVQSQTSWVNGNEERIMPKTKCYVGVVVVGQGMEFGDDLSTMRLKLAYRLF